jgi:hypothetical protein
MCQKFGHLGTQWASNFLGFKWVNLASQSLEREIPKDEEATVVLRIKQVPNN